MITTWTRVDWLQAGLLLGFIAVMHVAAFGVLFGAVGPGHYQLGTKIFGAGLGITAYTYGLRHAFDADHIAAIDNTTRKLRGRGAARSRWDSGSPWATPRSWRAWRPWSRPARISWAP